MGCGLEKDLNIINRATNNRCWIHSIFHVNLKLEDPKIISLLDDKGNVNGKKEFLFSLTNVGETRQSWNFPLG